MLIKVADWVAYTKEERFWLLENYAFQQWKARKKRRGMK